MNINYDKDIKLSSEEFRISQIKEDSCKTWEWMATQYKALECIGLAVVGSKHYTTIGEFTTEQIAKMFIDTQADDRYEQHRYVLNLK
jgi:hypothetical protein